MSKLTFKETLSSSGEDYSSSDSDSDISSDMDKHTPEESFADIEEEGPPPKRLKHEKDTTRSTVKSQDLESNSEKGVVCVSSFLSSFLSKRKTPQTPEAPVFPPMNDDILREFNESAMLTTANDPSHKHRRLSITSVDSLPGDNNPFDDQSSSDDEYVEEPADRSANLTLQLFNLPYAMKDDELRAAVESYGVAVESASMTMDKKTNRPSGSAFVLLKPPESSRTEDAHSEDPPRSVSEMDLSYAIECQNKLQDTNFSGRPVRVRAMGTKARLSLGGGGARYFGGDISVKCHRCGEVGHRMAECPRENVMQPCHFCAGTDHEPIDCTNIACHRCFRFGHHSKNCPSASRQLRPILCTLCGSRSHDKRFCRMTSVEAARKVEEPLEGLICLCCGKVGHAMCLVLPVMKNRALYCPSCGKEGHHIDYVKDSDREASCRKPWTHDTSSKGDYAGGSRKVSGCNAARNVDYKGSAKYRGQHGAQPPQPSSDASNSRSSSSRGGKGPYTSGTSMAQHQARPPPPPPAPPQPPPPPPPPPVASRNTQSTASSEYSSISSRFQEYSRQQQNRGGGVGCEQPQSNGSGSRGGRGRVTGRGHQRASAPAAGGRTPGSAFSRGGASTGRNVLRR